MIKWIEHPYFQLEVKDMRFNKFVCTRAGSAILYYNSKQYLLEFKLGWVTDLTSSPLFLRSIIPQVGEHSLMALIHDLCLKNMWSRDLAHYAMVCQGHLSVGYWVDQCYLSQNMGTEFHKSNLNSLKIMRLRCFLMKHGLKVYDNIIGDKYRPGVVVDPIPIEISK